MHSASLVDRLVSYLRGAGKYNYVRFFRVLEHHGVKRIIPLTMPIFTTYIYKIISVPLALHHGWSLFGLSKPTNWTCLTFRRLSTKIYPLLLG